jgi:hypothetical protein
VTTKSSGRKADHHGGMERRGRKTDRPKRIIDTAIVSYWGY